MKEGMTQQERLDFLVEAFKQDSAQYQHVPTPPDAQAKWRLLRSLMNIRMPRKMDPSILSVQDAYLRQITLEKGIVRLSDIPLLRESLSLWQGDITRLEADAIVNAANSRMLGCFVPMHSCIDNCIHTFAGVQLRAECAERMARLGADYEQPTAAAMLTDGYNLPAKKVVHIVGPIVKGQLSAANERELADCYRSTLDLCAEKGLKSVAFCCISTGLFRFPPRRAARIAFETVGHWLRENRGRVDRVIFNVFRDEDREYYEQLFSEKA